MITHRLFALLVVVICMMTVTSLRGQNKDPVKSWQQLGENDSLVIESLPINSIRDDYAPFFWDGKLYFTSDRKDRYTDEAALQYNESVYVSSYQDSVWSKPKKWYFFNSDDYTAFAGFSHDHSKVFMYKTFGGGDLYCSSQNNKGKWLRSTSMRSVNTPFHEQSIAEVNGIMVISSDRPGGLGNHDLYWSIAADDGQYRTFACLLMANTNGDEVDVSFGSDGKTLYFSSDVGGSSGGYDIFAMQIDSSRQWSKPQEISMNTSGNDRWFYDADSMFFCSRSGEIGDDLWWGHIVPKHQRDTISIQKIVSLDPELLIDTLVIDTLLVQQFTYLNKRPDSIIFFTPDGTPDTLKQEKLLSVYEKLDSLQFEVYTAQVQVGAYYYIRSVDEFKYNFGSFDTTGIIIEKIQTQRGTLYKYLIDETYSTLAAGAVRQQEALYQQTADVNRSYYPKGKPYDAFIVVYDKSRQRIIIYFNVETDDCQILVGDAKIKF